MNIMLDSEYYATWCKHVRLKDSTKSNYTNVYRHFGNYLLREGFTLIEGEKLNFDKFYYSPVEDDYEPIDLKVFIDYVEYLKENKSIHVVESHITALKNLFKFLENMEFIEDNPLSRFSGSYYVRPLKNRALSENQSELLLETAYNSDPFFKQWFVLILLQLTCGLRASELCKLKLSQINFDLNTIVINKGQKKFISSVHMTKALSNYLKEYLHHPSFKRWLGESEDKELFFYNHKPLTSFRLNSIIKSIASRANVKRKVTNHDLRASMAYLLYIKGVDERKIQSQLRHKKLSTTLLYLPIRNKLLT